MSLFKMESRLQNPTFASLDFETTGVVRGYPNEPWQLGVVTFDMPAEPGGTALEPLNVVCREWFFNIPADRPFSPRAPGRWAQMRGVLAAAPSFMEAWPELSEFIVGVPLVAHNAATERTILEKRTPLTRFGPWVDTLRIVRKYWPLMRSYALGDIIAVFGLKSRVDAICPGRTWHDALYDACAGAILLAHVAGILKFTPTQFLDDCSGGFLV